MREKYYTALHYAVLRFNGITNNTVREVFAVLKQEEEFSQYFFLSLLGVWL